MNEQVQAELKKIFNGRCSTSESTRANYARGEDTYDPVLSGAVVFPETNEEVSKVVRLCNENKIPVVPFGTGTSLEGNVVGNEKGITICLEKMNKILSVNVEDFDCRVQACVTKEQLNDYLREFRTKLEARKDSSEQISISISASQKEKTQALKMIDQLNRAINEVVEFEKDILYPLASQNITIDLDDGVKNNYPLFGTALNKVNGLS